MISDYLTDEITIINLRVDEDAVSTENTITGVKARIEEKSKLMTNREGREVVGSGPIFFEDIAGVTVDETSRIKIVKKNGVEQTRDTKEHAIKKLQRPHGFDKSHYQVWI